MSNYLPISTRTLAIKMLCEGTGLRPAARILDCQPVEDGLKPGVVDVPSTPSKESP